MPNQSLDEIRDLDPRRKTGLKPLDYVPGAGFVNGCFVEAGQMCRTMRRHDEADAMSLAESLEPQAVPDRELFDAIDRGHSPAEGLPQRSDEFTRQMSLPGR